MPEKSSSELNKHPVAVRALLGGYLSTSFVITFLAALSEYLEYSYASAVAIVIAVVVVPVLWLTDRITFDGRRIRRFGVVPRLFAFVTGTRDRLKISDIEQVETAAFPGLRRGRNVYFTYRTTIFGKGVRFTISSRYKGFGDVARSILQSVDEDILDITSIDVRDYFAEKREAGARVRRSEIPSSDVLDSSFRDIHLKPPNDDLPLDDNDSAERAKRLRRLANELRLSGFLVQALEAFRRAAILRPRDAKLLFEFAECIRSVAGYERDKTLERKARAMMRLAERHAGDDSELLSRIGESYFQVGDWDRAGIVFKRVVGAIGENFRTLRGQAELALREGKMAHVIHNFAAAEQVAATNSLKRWTRSEVEYFSHLNEDDEYMELEIGRINLLDTLDRLRRSTFRFALLGIVVIILGLALPNDLVANVGWAISAISLIIWIVTLIMSRMLAPRIPFELMEADE
jgi:tetratricopeptide (TPR) repeat protein